MSAAVIRREEGVGLVLAVVLHAAVLALLMLRPAAPVPPVPQRMTVTIADEVGLKDTAPQPQARAAADAAPTLGEPAPEPSAAPPAPPVTPVTKVPPRPEPRRPQPARPEPVKLEPKPQPKPRPAPSPQVAAKTAPKPPLKTTPAPARARPDPIADAVATARGKGKAATPGTAKPEKPARTPGASRIGNDFLKGLAGSQSSGKATTPAAATIGPEVKAGLASAIARQLKPHWTAPQGADAEQLVTVLAFDLNEDGSLDGVPRVVRQEGITDSNRAQAPRHAEQAIRAVRLSAPFDLPSQYYPAWKRVTAFRFDRKLSQ
ncbi:MAG: hypothetical protein KGM17_12490 [Sphingomonadales bacterium]|nr:hypothetical protein [Sphingomonadales bacterium]